MSDRDERIRVSRLKLAQYMEMHDPKNRSHHEMHQLIDEFVESGLLTQHEQDGTIWIEFEQDEFERRIAALRELRDMLAPYFE